jgi:hypothetical protein
MLELAFGQDHAAFNLAVYLSSASVQGVPLLARLSPGVHVLQLYRAMHSMHQHDCKAPCKA